jgi:hypothetical protein
MQSNPFIFENALDPNTDSSVIIKRKEETRQIVEGIENGEYWLILAPQQSGKTTFLFQLQHEITKHHCIYINLETLPVESGRFYNYLKNTILKNTENYFREDFDEKLYKVDSMQTFLHFLKNISFKGEKKIVLLFDNLGSVSIEILESFSYLWKNIHLERGNNPELKRLSVILAGSTNISSVAKQKSSNSSIYKKLYLKDFDKDQVLQFVNNAKTKNFLELSETLTEELIYQTSGHPQLLQQLCYILAEVAHSKNKILEQIDFENALEQLILNNNNLKILYSRIKLYNLQIIYFIKQLLQKQQTRFLPFQPNALESERIGLIRINNGFCEIRNKIYEKYLQEFL